MADPRMLDDGYIQAGQTPGPLYANVIEPPADYGGPVYITALEILRWCTSTMPPHRGETLRVNVFRDYTLVLWKGTRSFERWRIAVTPALPMDKEIMITVTHDCEALISMSGYHILGQAMVNLKSMDPLRRSVLQARAIR
jgi:hypothetical protein